MGNPIVIVSIVTYQQHDTGTSTDSIGQMRLNGRFPELAKVTFFSDDDKVLTQELRVIPLAYGGNMMPVLKDVAYEY